MARLKKLDASKRLEVQIPTSVYSKVQLELYSELEGKVPFGEMSRVVTDLLTQWLRDRGVAV